MLIGETLDNQVKTYIRPVRDSGDPIASLIGASLREPHTSEKDVCDRPSTEIYDQMWKIVCHHPLNGKFTIKIYKTNKC